MLPLPTIRRLGAFCAVLLGSAAALVGCGDAPDSGSQAGLQGPAAPGPGPAELLERLALRLVAGGALSDESWGQDVDFLRRLLWPDPDSEPALRAVKVHAAASHVAGDVAREIARDPGARQGLESRDAVSLALHDGWIQAAQAGPEAYRRWCEGPGQDLLKQLEAARARLFERPWAGTGR
jgi:hypothetical protein